MKRSNEKKVRDSRFELLRCLAMLMIILQHPLERCTEEEWGMLYAPFSLNFVGAISLTIWGQLGVMLFVMISAWFMVDKQGISGKKILLLLAQVWTVCIGILIVFAVAHPESLSLKLIAKELLTPVNRKHYWFISTFLAFYISIPLLQLVVQSLNDRVLRNTCIVFTVLIPLYNYLYENVGSSWADFCYYFLVIAYLKRNPDNWFRHHCRLFLGIMASIVGILLVYKLLLVPKLGTGSLVTLFKMLRGRTLLLFVCALCLFFCFVSMKPICSKLINTLGSAMFGVYLLHENYLIRGEADGSAWLWNEITHIDEHYQNDEWFILYYIVVVLVVFALCIVIDLIRQHTVERLYRSGKLLAKAGEWFDQFYGRLLFRSEEI